MENRFLEVVKNKSFEVAMTSLQVAEITRKTHSHVIRDIEDETNKLGEEIAETIFGLSEYKDKTGRTLKMYNLSKDGAMQLGARYDATTRYKMIQRINELERNAKPMLPQSYKEALIALVMAEEEKERLMLVNVELEKTKAYISDKKTATAMNTASRLSKENKNLEIQLDKSKEYSTIKRMQLLNHGISFDWRKLKSASSDLNIEPINVYDSNYGTVKAYHKDAWLEAYGLDINE